MKYEKKEIGNNLIMYRLIGEKREEKFNRMSMYNDFLFQNMESLTNRRPKTVIVINENNTGGIIYSSYDFIERALENLKKYNKLEITNQKRMNTYSRKISKIAFSCKEKERKYGREVKLWK